MDQAKAYAVQEMLEIIDYEQYGAVELSPGVYGIKDFYDDTVLTHDSQIRIVIRKFRSRSDRVMRAAKALGL